MHHKLLLEVVVVILFACLCDCVCERVFFWECTCRCFVKYNSSWVTNIFTCRQYLKYELFLYWPIEVIVKDKALKQWLKKFHLFLQEKNIKKETNEKRIKELIWCYYHRADFWTQKVFIQLTESGAYYCWSSGCFNCQTWSVGSEFCL